LVPQHSISLKTFWATFSFPELADVTLSLMDIIQNRLRTSEIVAHKVAEFFGTKPTIEATLRPPPRS